MKQERMTAAQFRTRNAMGATGKVARGRKKPDGMNGLETRYAAYLQSLVQAGEVLWFAFEALKLRLADNTFYTPDFFLMLANGELEVRETKGYWEDDARVKVKVAASMYPFRFFAVKEIAKKNGGGWSVEAFE